MRIAVLAGTERNLYAVALIQRLFQGGYPVTAALLGMRRTPFQILPKVWNIKKIVQKLDKRARMAKPNHFLVQYMVQHGLSPQITVSQLARTLGYAIIHYGDLNGEDSVSLLERTKPDFLLYCAGGILRKNIISVPTIGVLNAHMALLPKYRGMNVLEWSTFYGDPLGVTIHFIDEGIDTGGIVLQRQLPFTPGDDLETLRLKSVVLNVELMTEAIRLFGEAKAERKPNPKADGKQYFVMHPMLKELTEKRLRERCTS